MIMRVAKKLKQFPVLLGVLIAVAICLPIFVIVTWLPGIYEAWDRNNANVRSVYFTIVLFAVWISYSARWRRRNQFLFWVALSLIFLTHVIGILFYSITVHPLLMGQWMILLIAESGAIVFGMDWLTRHFHHTNWHRRSDKGA